MTTRTFSGTLQNKTGTAAAWASANPTLPKGQIGVELDTNKIKVGDGVNAWSNLNYTNAGNADTIEPHNMTSVDDDMYLAMVGNSQIRYSSNITANPAAGKITATTFDGTATKATADADGNNIINTYATKPVTVSASWAANSATCTITNAAITVTSTIFFGVPTTITAANYDILANAKIICTSQSAGGCVLTALGTAPTSAIDFNITVVN